MTTNKFITVPSGTGLPTLTTAIGASGGAGDANKIIATDSTGKLDPSFLPTGVGVSTESVVASEALSAGDLVNFYNNGGTRNVRKADASNGRYAQGFVLTSVTNGGTATVYIGGTVTGLTSLTIGSNYFLSASTPGGFTATPPSTSGQSIQLVGYATSTTTIHFRPLTPIAIS